MGNFAAFEQRGLLSLLILLVSTVSSKINSVSNNLVGSTEDKEFSNGGGNSITTPYKFDKGGKYNGLTGAGYLDKYTASYPSGSFSYYNAYGYPEVGNYSNGAGVNYDYYSKKHSNNKDRYLTAPMYERSWRDFSARTSNAQPMAVAASNNLVNYVNPIRQQNSNDVTGPEYMASASGGWGPPPPSPGWGKSAGGGGGGGGGGWGGGGGGGGMMGGGWGAPMMGGGWGGGMMGGGMMGGGWGAPMMSGGWGGGMMGGGGWGGGMMMGGGGWGGGGGGGGKGGGPPPGPPMMNPISQLEDVLSSLLGLIALIAFLQLLANLLMMFFMAATTTTMRTTTQFQFPTTRQPTFPPFPGRRRRGISEYYSTTESYSFNEQDPMVQVHRISMLVLPSLNLIAHARDGRVPLRCTYREVCLTNSILVKELGVRGRPIGYALSTAIKKVLKEVDSSDSVEEKATKAALAGRSGKDCALLYPQCKALGKKGRESLPLLLPPEKIPEITRMHAQIATTPTP